MEGTLDPCLVDDASGKRALEGNWNASGVELDEAGFDRAACGAPDLDDAGHRGARQHVDNAGGRVEVHHREDIVPVSPTLLSRQGKSGASEVRRPRRRECRRCEVHFIGLQSGGSCTDLKGRDPSVRLPARLLLGSGAFGDPSRKCSFRSL